MVVILVPVTITHFVLIFNTTMESSQVFNKTNVGHVGEPANLPDSCNEFNTLVIPSKEVAELDGLIYSPREKLLTSYVIPAIAIFGILCNMAFIFVLIRVKSMHMLVNVYLANLAIADMCFLANTLGIRGISLWNFQINNSLPFTKP